MSEKHKSGGFHAFYRKVRAFLRWYAVEFEPAGWLDPMLKVKPPKVHIESFEPVPLYQKNEERTDGSISNMNCRFATTGVYH